MIRVASLAKGTIRYFKTKKYKKCQLLTLAEASRLLQVDPDSSNHEIQNAFSAKARVYYGSYIMVYCLY